MNIQKKKKRKSVFGLTIFATQLRYYITENFEKSKTFSAPVTGPTFLKFQARGLRTETEFIGFHATRARTAPATGPPFKK